MDVKISDRVKDLENELIEIRRKFHQNPEVGFEEQETSTMIAEHLREWGLEVFEGIGKTGVVGVIDGDSEGKTIAIRADIDALPIEENTGIEFSSKNEGTMHACGHDGHIAIGLTTAKLLSGLKDRIKGKIVFLFQPAEETLAGAKAMIDDGVINDFGIDAVVGLHIWPDVESGKIGVKKGPIMAAVDKFEIEIIGKGGHGAIPQKSVDPVVIASDVVNAFQKIISREVDPLKSGVITVGTFNAGTAFNIIPDKVKMSGTVRTFDASVREHIAERMEKIVTSITEGHRAKYNFDYDFGIPATDNNPDLTEGIISKLKETFGEKRVLTEVRPSMGGEDFSLFQKEVPGTYMFLGTHNEEKGITKSIHHPEYNIDEDVLKYGVEAFSEIVLDYLDK